MLAPLSVGGGGSGENNTGGHYVLAVPESLSEIMAGLQDTF